MLIIIKCAYMKNINECMRKKNEFSVPCENKKLKYIKTYSWLKYYYSLHSMKYTIILVYTGISKRNIIIYNSSR